MGAIYDSNTKLIFGQSDITFGGVALPLLAEAVVLKVEPSYTDIKVYDFGEGAVDRICTGYNITITTALAEESVAALQLAIPVSTQTDTVDSLKTNLADAPVGTSLRAFGKELKIHPRSAGLDTSTDVVIFKAIPTGTFERNYGFEQGKIPVTFTAVVKDGAKAGKIGNYFTFGDPTVSTAPAITLTSALTEAGLIAGGQTIEVDLVADTFAVLTDPIKTAIVAGITGVVGGTKATILPITSVVRTSATKLTITLVADASYSIAANETWTVTIPTVALTTYKSALAPKTAVVTAT